jgi:hypothetical protein
VVPAVAAGRGDVVVIASGAIAGFTGRVKVMLSVLFDESLTVMENDTEAAPAGGVPDR